MAQSVRAFVLHAEGWVFESQPRQTLVVKTGMTVPLPNARQQVWVSRVLGDDHYKLVSHVTVGVARLRTRTAHRSSNYNIGQVLLNVNGFDRLLIFIWKKLLWVYLKIWSTSPVTMTSPYEWKILDWDLKRRTNKQKLLKPFRILWWYTFAPNIQDI